MYFCLVFSYLVCLFLILLVENLRISLFIIPIKTILKLIFNSLLGGLLIYIINIIGVAFNFHIGLNVFTSIFIGILGIPGVVLTIIIKILIG